jgi:LacI family transcriptional regulator
MAQVGIREIARLAGVSIGTVDRALHGRPGISEVTRQKILSIAQQTGYSPDPAARALAVGRAQFRIGVCIPKEIHFFYDQMREGIFEEARRAARLGVEVVYRPVPSLGEGEKHQLTALLKEGIRGLLVVPGNPGAVAPLINRAEAKGVRVVCVSSDAPGSHRSTVVCVDPELNGRLAAELLSKLIPHRSEAAVVTGMLQTEDHRRKVEGFRAAFAQHSQGGRIAAILEAHESEQESYRKTRELLSRHRNLRGIYVSTVNCLPVCRALGEHKRAAEIRLVATDLFLEMVPYFEKGIIGASIYQDPYTQGRNAMRILVDHLVEKTPIAAANYLNPGIVLQSNLQLFREIR